MTAKLTIQMSDELIDALVANKSITISLLTGGGTGGDSGAGHAGAPREGSLPARVIEWATKRGKDFGIADVVKSLRITRMHASMLLSNMVKAGRIARASRGVYRAAS